MPNSLGQEAKSPVKEEKKIPAVVDAEVLSRAAREVKNAMRRFGDTAASDEGEETWEWHSIAKTEEGVTKISVSNNTNILFPARGQTRRFFA